MLRVVVASREFQNVDDLMTDVANGGSARLLAVLALAMRTNRRSWKDLTRLLFAIKGIGALDFRCADWVYTDDLPVPSWDSVCKAEFWTSSKYVDFRSHQARPRNSFDIASSEGNVVHLKTASGSGADATGGESPFQLCLLNPITILNATVVGLPFILAVVEVPKGWSMGLPPLAVQHVSMGKPLVVAGNWRTFESS